MKLFISYATENRKIAEEIYFALIGAGHEVFFDQPSLKPGDNYVRRLREAIKSADGMIFMISPDSVQKGSYALTELKYARKKWAHPERRVLPVIVQPTSFKEIPAYLRAVTLLQPEGNIPAEVVTAIQDWGEPPPVVNKRQGMFYQIRGLLLMLVYSIILAASLGTLFSLTYPSVEIDSNLAFLFVLVGVMIVFSVRRLYKAIWRGKM